MFPGRNELNASFCNNLGERECWLYRDNFLCVPSQWEMMLHCKVISHWLGAYRKWSLTLHEIRCILLAVRHLPVCCPDDIFVLSTRVMNLCQQCYQHNWYIWACHSYIPWGHHSVCNWYHCLLEWPVIAQAEPSNILTMCSMEATHSLLINTFICSCNDSNINNWVNTFLVWICFFFTIEIALHGLLQVLITGDYWTSKL